MVVPRYICNQRYVFNLEIYIKCFSLEINCIMFLSYNINSIFLPESLWMFIMGLLDIKDLLRVSEANEVPISSRI